MPELEPIPKKGDPRRLEVLQQNLFTKGDEIASHILEKHKGLPATTCHRCLTLASTYRDLQLLVQIEEQGAKSIRDDTDKPLPE